ncbi:uncharacterized protein LOC62_01G001598 [Vanrija pseudolonga]|uniref:Cupin type-2 domain-containing protein n=1 Tax=Vanrija pseudolonga TaxID=143232 RepID=A0AAF1BHU7_9TREE|nr:hypothetical protein LOC62_01G001598 [Vanrija pseudolonga]
MTAPTAGITIDTVLLWQQQHAPRPPVSAWERRPGAMAVFKSSRARPNKHQYGWGNLPDQLIHRIVSHVNDATQLELIRPVPPTQAAVALALTQRKWLSAARLVSAGWCAAIDSHPFWIQYEATLSPATTDDDQNINKTGPSLTPYQSARRATMAVCIPCRLSLRNPYPPGRGLPGLAQRVPTLLFGPVASCQFHAEGGFCHDCLRENVLSAAGRDSTDPISLRITDPKDCDVTGEVRGRRYTCHNCRQAIISAAIERELIMCARGTYVRGLDAPWHYTAPFQDYVWEAEGSSERQAKRAVEEHFLGQHTRWNDWERKMLEVQRDLTLLKLFHYECRPANMIRNQIDKVRQFCALVWGEENEELVDFMRLQRGWRNDIDSGRYTERDYRLDLARFRAGQRDQKLWDYLRLLLHGVCINAWANDRVEYGLWVLPSDDIDQRLMPDKSLFTPLREYALLTFNPLKHEEARFGATNQNALAMGEGQFKFTNPTAILPPERILNLMNEKFTSLLVRRLEMPLSTIVEYKSMSCRDGEAEKVCEAMQLPDILGLLRDQAGWLEGWPFEPEDPNPGWRPTTRGEDSVTEPASPRIELVKMETDDDDVQVERYGILRDGWSDVEEDDEMMSEDGASLRAITPEDDDEWEDASSETDGPEEEEEETNDEPTGHPVRPRLGERNATYNSSEGESTRTALVTPDDSPDLLVGSIQLAPIDVDDVAVTFAHQVPSTPRNVEPVGAMSPTLGKRKSPGDDDREEPPARRRSPQTSHGSDAGSTIVSLESEDKSPSLVSMRSSPSEPAVSATAVPAFNKPTLPTPPASEPTNIQKATTPAPAEPAAPAIIAIQQPVKQNPTPTQQVVQRALTPESDDFSSATSTASWDGPNEAAYVPPRNVQLGPGTTGILSAAWWNACESIASAQRDKIHPMNPASVRHTACISDMAGMQDVGVGIHKVDLAPGVESTMLHSHAAEAEWIYVLAGSAVCVLGWGGEVEEHEVKAGDFIGLPPGPPATTYAHLLRAGPSGTSYLLGGDRRPLDVISYPPYAGGGARTLVVVGDDEAMFDGVGEMHHHLVDSEWLYILSGSAELRLTPADARPGTSGLITANAEDTAAVTSVTVNEGDYVAFPAGPVGGGYWAHTLVGGAGGVKYLIGGMRSQSDVCVYPL